MICHYGYRADDDGHMVVCLGGYRTDEKKHVMVYDKVNGGLMVRPM